MKKLLLILMFVTAMAVSPAYSQISKTDLKAAVEMINKECPMDQGDGMSVTSITCSDTQLTYSFLFKGVPESALKHVADTVSPELLKTFRADPEMNMILESCKANKINMVFRFSNEKGETGVCTIPYTKI